MSSTTDAEEEAWATMVEAEGGCPNKVRPAKSVRAQSSRPTESDTSRADVYVLTVNGEEGCRA